MMKEREEAWIRTRRIGFASFIIPVSIITGLLLFWANEKVYADLYPLKEGAIKSVIIYFSVWLNIEVFLNVFKYYLCRRTFGMSQAHFRLIIGRRDRWSTTEIKMLENCYGMNKLKVMDAIYRRAGHIIVNAWRIYFYLFLVNQELRL